MVHHARVCLTTDTKRTHLCPKEVCPNSVLGECALVFPLKTLDNEKKHLGTRPEAMFVCISIFLVSSAPNNTSPQKPAHQVGYVLRSVARRGSSLWTDTLRKTSTGCKILMLWVVLQLKKSVKKVLRTFGSALHSSECTGLQPWRNYTPKYTGTYQWLALTQATSGRSTVCSAVRRAQKEQN